MRRVKIPIRNSWKFLVTIMAVKTPKSWRSTFRLQYQMYGRVKFEAREKKRKCFRRKMKRTVMLCLFFLDKTKKIHN